MEMKAEGKRPWVSFCMSTYRRPEMLKEQIAVILQQTFKDFEIVISDNDPESQLSTLIESFNDDRIRYSVNEVNLGMVKSFNRSIERSNGEFVVMITDDDPVENNFLEEMYSLKVNYPGCSLYGGFLRKDKPSLFVEKIEYTNVIEEILDMSKTPSILWSSCIMLRKDVVEIGGMPDYGSPHLADHALIAMVGSKNGVVVQNKMYSHIIKHDANFSKLNFHLYVIGCESFFQLMTEFVYKRKLPLGSMKGIVRHLHKWFIVSYFDLKRYYTKKKELHKMADLQAFKIKMFEFEFMSGAKLKFSVKSFIFSIKKFLSII